MVSIVGYEKPANFHHNKKAGKDRGGQRVRKLQLSDVEWYVSTPRLVERSYVGDAGSPATDPISRPSFPLKIQQSFPPTPLQNLGLGFVS